jgi:hypothetical protein
MAHINHMAYGWASPLLAIPTEINGTLGTTKPRQLI